MTVSYQQWIFWVVCATAKMFLAGVLVRKHAVGRWPSLLVMCCFASLRTASLMYLSLSHDLAHYSYVYWYSQPVDYLLEVWLIADVIRSIPGTMHLNRSIKITCSLASFGSAILFWILSNGGASTGVAAEVHRLDRLSSIAWLAFVLTLVGCLSLLGLGWPLVTLSVCGAYLFSLASDAVSSYFLAAYPASAMGVFLGRCLSATVVTIWWAQVVVRTSNRMLLSNTSSKRIEKFNLAEIDELV